MQVVLKADVKGLGRPGQLVEVSDGYARNYLFPRSLAEEATSGVLKKVAEANRAAANKEARQLAEAQAEAKRLDGQAVTIRVKAGAQGRLFGAVTAADIAAAITQGLGVHVDKRRLDLKEPVKRVGEQRVEVRLAHDVRAVVRVVVEAEKGG